jgi:hypothetical protein
MVLHILNGDSLAHTLQNTILKDTTIICRECLIDGPLSPEIDEAFFLKRAEYISSSYNETHQNYFSKIVNELDKLKQIPQHSDVYLWFENDLYCQVNMWFIISLISNNCPNINFYRIFPSIKNLENKWSGFSDLKNEETKELIKNRIRFTESDIELSKNLWNNYAVNNKENLKRLTKTGSDCFKYLEEVIQAHIDRTTENTEEGRPEKILKEIISEGKKNFNDIFFEFNKTEGVYGFGDLQVKLLLKNKLNYGL